MERVPVDSKAVRSVGYDASSATLEIEFGSGRIYQYFDVAESVFEWLLRTPSKGSYVNRMIQPKYAYRDVSAAPEAAPDELEKRLAESVRWLERKPR